MRPMFWELVGGFALIAVLYICGLKWENKNLRKQLEKEGK